MNNSTSSTDSPFYFFASIAYLVILAITLPAILFAIYVLYHQIRLNQAVHVYVINLLISDILQFVGRLSLFFSLGKYLPIIFVSTTEFGISLSVNFMMCIAMERYLMIAHPLWYSAHCTVKCSILMSVGVWIGSIIILAALISVSLSFQNQYFILSAVLLSLPFPLLLFLFVGTWRGLSKALTLSTREKRRILAILGLVIVNYTLIFLPCIIVDLAVVSFSPKFHVLALLLLCMNPLSDLLLYIFVRKDTRRILEDIPCCRRTQTDHEETDPTALTSL